jgi:superfamily I DNA and/or RNA helicase
MRYKAIRDLASGDSGEVLKNLKPVWLMSPLSVSDTLPLDSGCFDVVIFDEASQITLEEAVPSLFRATQAIVVGDEMQLPPTTFFAAKQSDDEEELIIEEEGETINYELGSSSFLNHAARNLPATMLGWHYRSRSESLISFSNWAFYDGRLLTVPEERLPPANRPPLTAEESIDAEQGADELVARPISFHFMKNGTYEQRRNTMEADYIASLVRRLLTCHSGLSIGVIAFSGSSTVGD